MVLKNFFRSCAMDESSLSIGRVKYFFYYNSTPFLNPFYISMSLFPALTSPSLIKPLPGRSMCNHSNCITFISSSFPKSMIIDAWCGTSCQERLMEPVVIRMLAAALVRYDDHAKQSSTSCSSPRNMIFPTFSAVFRLNLEWPVVLSVQHIYCLTRCKLQVNSAKNSNWASRTGPSLAPLGKQCFWQRRASRTRPSLAPPGKKCFGQRRASRTRPSLALLCKKCFGQRRAS